MPESAPTVTVPTTAGEKTVAFDFDRLVAIEDACDATINAVCQEIAGYIPTDSTPQHIETAARKLRLGYVRRFVAGCLGVAPARLSELIPIAAVKPAFVSLIGPFFEAVSQLNAVEGDAEGDRVADPQVPAQAG